MKLAWEDPRSNRGYVARGRERVTQETDAVKIAQMRESAPDAKESMEIGRDWDPTWKVGPFLSTVSRLKPFWTESMAKRGVLAWV